MAAPSGSFFSTLQKVGQSLMVPVSVLPAAGLLVALGRIVQDLSMSHGEVTIPAIHAVGQFLFSGGLAIFEQLPVVFAIGVAIGFSGGAGVAGLASVVGYFTLVNVLKVMGEVRHLDLAINTGVFGGIIMGLISAKLYNHYFQTKLHPVFGFFAGKRLVPIITAATAIVVGLVLGLVWPPIQSGINEMGGWAMNSILGPAFYAAGKRLLIPVGLHHVYYPPFLFEFGEFVTAAGKTLNGDSARYFAGDPTAGKFMASEFPIMLFGLPAAAFAMYLRAPKAKRKAVGGIMLSAALTSIITGITEPIEFAFIFVAPILYIFHVLAAFCSGLLTGLFDIHLGYTFSASLIDFVVGYFNQKNSMYLWLLVGPAVGLVYFGVFYTAIGWLNLKTPGREDSSEESVDLEAVHGSQKAREILVAIGGSKNIEHLDACITRLRLTVNNPKLVDTTRLKALGAAGVMASKNNFQIIFGTESDLLKEEIFAIMDSGSESSQDTLRMPIKGEILSLSDVPDATFADKILGDGFAIKPIEGKVYAPFDGEVVQLFRTSHAIGLKNSSGVEVLIHIGLDTVKLEGKGFTPKVNQGDHVKAGDLLIEFDLNYVKENAKSVITPIVFTSLSNYKGFQLHSTSGVTPMGDNVVSFQA